MAYMNQQKKAVIQEALKAVVPAGWKYTLAVRNHSTIVFTLRQAPVDILGNIRESLNSKGQYADFGGGSKVTTYWDVNPYNIANQFSGDVLAVMLKINDALNTGNHDNSDIQTDYFDVGWYVDINIGRWNDPFLDTVPAPARPKVVATLKSPLLKEEYTKYLPADWATMSPGKKAAATKAAMRMAGG